MQKPEQIPFDLGHRHAYGRDDFWVSSSNQNAVAWIDSWEKWQQNFLIISGAPASGKTHLLQVWKGEAKASEIDAYNLSFSLAEEILRKSKMIALDNADKILGHIEKEQALLHIYNSVKEMGGRLVLCLEKPVAEYDFALPDLKSRLAAVPNAKIESPDDELIAVVMTKLFSDKQIFVPQEVISFLVPRVERSFAAVKNTVDAIDKQALVSKKPVTIPLVKEVMQ